MRGVVGTMLILALPVLASATTIHVPSDQPTISLGLAAASSGDTVLVACGEYQNVYLNMASGVTLKAEANSCVTLNAVITNRVFHGSDLAPGTRIEGFIIIGGEAPDGSGGAMNFASSDVEIRACWFISNHAFGWGGAISLIDCDALIESSFIQANHAAVYGGGIAAHGGTLTLRDSGLDANQGLWGGGLYLDDGAAVIEDCTFTHNSSASGGRGGAIHVAGGSTLQMTGSTVAGNSSGLGAGIFIDENASATLAESIVAQNSGTGLHDDPGGVGPGDLALSCSDVYGNLPFNYGGNLVDQTGIDGNISANPLFCELDAYDLPNVSLAQDSPCLPENNECGVQMGARGLGCEIPTAVGEAPAQAAALLPNRPNPFNPSTEIVFSLAQPGAVTLTLHDLAGRRLATLLAAVQRPAGEQSVRWDGRDGAGRSLPSGVYLARLEAADRSMSRKLTLLK